MIPRAFRSNHISVNAYHGVSIDIHSGVKTVLNNDQTTWFTTTDGHARTVGVKTVLREKKALR